jgi:chromosome segregation ATPase
MEKLKAELATALERVKAEKERADAAEKERDDARKERDNARADSESDALAKLRKERDQAVARADGLDTQLSNEKKARAAADQTVAAAVRARVDLESKAKNILGSEDGIESMSDRDLRVAVIRKVDGEDVVIDDTKSDDYVTARYDSAIERAEESLKAIAAARGGGRADALTDEKARRDAMIERNRNAWKVTNDGQ